MNEKYEIEQSLKACVKKLVAEDYTQGQLYTMWTLAASPDQKPALSQLFGSIAAEETAKHAMQLVAWCDQNNCEVPCSEAEIKRLATAKTKSAMSSIRRGQPASYYVDQAIKQKQATIIEHRKAIDNQYVCQYTELQALLWSIYYDEEEHLRKLETAKSAFGAGAGGLVFGY